MKLLLQQVELFYLKMLAKSCTSYTWQLLCSPLILLSYIYKYIFQIIHLLKCRNQRIPKAFTITVGNITVGGTGKTPLIAKILQDIGCADDVIYITRGYRAEKKPISHKKLLKGKDALYDIVGDEACLLAHRFPTLSIAITSQSKAETVCDYDQSCYNKALIVDDGLQHDEIGFHLSIATISGENPFGYGWLLPRGLLREPIDRLYKVNYIVVTCVRPPSPYLLTSLERRFQKPLIVMKSVLTRLFDFERKAVSLPTKVTGVFLITSIANPHRVLELVEEQLHVKVISHYIAADHANVSPDHIHKWITTTCQERMLDYNDIYIISTEKDWVKYTNWKHLKAFTIFLEIDFQVIRGQKIWRDCLSEIKKGIYKDTID